MEAIMQVLVWGTIASILAGAVFWSFGTYAKSWTSEDCHQLLKRLTHIGLALLASGLAVLLLIAGLLLVML